MWLEVIERWGGVVNDTEEKNGVQGVTGEDMICRTDYVC